jgi:hypothetical protein
VADPLEELQEPKTKEVTRISVYFTHGEAQDFNIDEGDTVEHGEKGFVIQRKNGAHETVLFANICWYRVVTLVVPVKGKK